MSDHIGHIGICDDSFRLAQVHPGIHPLFKQVMQTHRDDAHMGSITRYADKWSAMIIAQARDQMEQPEGQRDPLALRKLTFVLGSLTHRAADRLTKPITNCWSGHPDNETHDGGGMANESKIMQDIFVFKEVFASGNGDVTTPFTPQVIGLWDAKAQNEFEAMYRLLLRRALIAMHTINPDAGHIDEWFAGFFKGLQTYPKNLEMYARLAKEWPADKVRLYLTEKRFYQRDDVLIVLARKLQQGGQVSGDEVVAAQSKTDTSHSRYARALAKAIDYLLAAGDLYERKLTVEQAKVKFDVGVPELSLQD